VHAAVARPISAGEGGGLAHGPTFMGNPLACAVANASIALLRAGLGGEVGASRAVCGRSGAAAGAAGVADVRVLGAIGVVQLDTTVDVAEATAAAVDAGCGCARSGT
jgi:adenosylmethionine-8-amino-7-oxononanoate aminotransferase